MKRFSAALVIATIFLTGCSAGAGVAPSPSPSAPVSQAAASHAPVYAFSVPEIELLRAQGWSEPWGEDDAKFISAAHDYCDAATQLSDVELFSRLKGSDTLVRSTQIIKLLCGSAGMTKVAEYAAMPQSWADGTYYVGAASGELPPGEYRTTGPAQKCYWSRSSKGGDIIANDHVENAPGGVRITVAAADYRVETSRCGIWVPA